jgi:hypothetical protein
MYRQHPNGLLVHATYGATIRVSDEDDQRKADALRHWPGSNWREVLSKAPEGGTRREVGTGRVVSE